MERPGREIATAKGYVGREIKKKCNDGKGKGGKSPV